MSLHFWLEKNRENKFNQLEELHTVASGEPVVMPDNALATSVASEVEGDNEEPKNEKLEEVLDEHDSSKKFKRSRSNRNSE